MEGSAMAASSAPARSAGMTRVEKRVVFAASLGTVFEWYDFYLYGALATIIADQFFDQFPRTTREFFALLAFAAGFVVRPLGAAVFGRIGDLVGRKYTFLIAIMIMALSTFIVGLLPGSRVIGVTAPILLLILRMLQGLALGGEYGGAATYIAEHAPNGRRGYYTSWLQTTATLGLLLSLLVILATRSLVGEQDFADYAWRFPFFVSFALLTLSLWIRLKLAETPAFQRMQARGGVSRAPLTEAFGRWSNAKIALLALFGLIAGQAVVLYTGQFYALFFLQSNLQVDGFTSSVLLSWALAFGAVFFVFFGWLSDRVGRKPIILVGCLIAALAYMPIFRQIASLANPALDKAIRSSDEEIKKLNERLNVVRNNAEYQATLFSIENVRKDRDAMQEDCLHLLEQIETHRPDVVAADAVVAEEKGVLEGFLREAEALRASRADAIAEVRGRREQVAQGLPEDLLREYEGLYKTRDNMAVCPVESSYCQGCYSKITMNDTAKLMGGTSVVRCGACQRILYLSR